MADQSENGAHDNNAVEGMDTQSEPPVASDDVEQSQEECDPTPCEPTQEITANQSSTDDRKLFIGGLHRVTHKESLKKYFEKYGAVDEVDIKDDKNNPINHRGFAFVTMSDSASVDVILETSHKIDDKDIDCKRALPHSIYQAQKNRTKKVFVGGVPTDMPEETIQEYFNQFGEIDEVALVTEREDKNKRRGFVFVTYKSFDSVDICTKENFHSVDGSKVEVKRATPREDSSNRGGGGGVGRFPYRGGGQMDGGRGGGGSGWMPYGANATYGGYGGYNNQGGYGYDGYCEPSYQQQDRGGYSGSRYGPMKGNPNSSRGFHPYGR